MSVEVTRLPSGLTVVTDSMPHLQTASLGVWVGSGSRDEQPDEHGISHLLEHMAFKGTKRRSARQIAEEIEAVGGDINAATSFETTAYFASVLKADMPLAIDVLSDILSNPTFDPAELKREQNVIVQEIGATEDAPDDLVFDYLQSVAFPNQPMGRSILGTPETVCSFKDKHLRAYLVAQLSRARHGGGRDRRGRARRGAWPRSSGGSAISTARRRRCRSPPNSAAAPSSKRAISSRCISRWRSKACRSAIPNCSACRCSRSCWAAACRRGCSRRCARSAGLCYTISAFHAPYSDTGMFGIYAGTDAGDVKELMRVVVDETAAAAAIITEAEVNRAKAQIKVGLLMALESSGARARQLASQILTYGRPLPIEEMVARIEA